MQQNNFWEMHLLIQLTIYIKPLFGMIFLLVKFKISCYSNNKIFVVREVVMNEQEIINSLHTGFIDSSKESIVDYRPDIIVNNKDIFPNEKVITTFLDELNHCKSYMFSVAFITSGGVAPLLTTLKELDDKGIKGKILTGSYLGFTQPEPLRVLDSLENTEVRLIEEDFHAKGYVFEHDEYSTLIIGSANLTQSALASTTEWNMKLSSLENGEILKILQSRFEDVWCKAKSVESIIDEYEKWFIDKQGLTRYLHPVRLDNKTQSKDGIILPNKMQKAALKKLSNIRNILKQNKALAIAATGSGKTILAALDVQAFKPKRMLFVVHRENVAKKSMDVFKAIISDNDENFGLLSGSSKELKKKYLFATVQTLNKKTVYESFKKDEFDYIILDEAHHTGAQTWYGAIMEYFNPKFLLGLTATPERMDSVDILKNFDYNIASNVRLNDALEAHILSPFHYYGIAELKINGEDISDKSTFSQLESDARVKHLINNIKFYTMYRKNIKGLVFCRNLEEAEMLSIKFSSDPYRYRTIWLSGESSLENREKAIEGLKTGKYEFIFTYDVFNEGVDIPAVNLVVMLRPTKSTIVMIQQLGRGLRKYKNKEYLTVLDFIGNYDNNFLIPAALSGSTTYSKYELKTSLMHPETMVYGDSSINFDTISKKRIFNSIDRTYKTKFLSDEYYRIKKYIGRIPKMMDFINNEGISPLLFIDKYKSYWNFKLEVEDDIIDFKEGTKFKDSLYGLSKYIANGVKKYDIEFLRDLITKRSFELKKEKISPSMETTLRMYQNLFYKKQVRKLSGNISYCTYIDNKVTISSEFSEMLENRTYYDEVIDLLNMAFFYNSQVDSKQVDNGFELYKLYRRDEIFRIIGAQADMSSHSMGYIYVPEVNVYPLFVTLHKDKNAKQSNLDFNDGFIDNRTFKWQSTIDEGVNSKRSKGIINFKENNTKVLIFVRKWKNKNDLKFHYIGSVNNINEVEESEKWYAKKNKLAPITDLKFEINPPVDERFFGYIKDLENLK